MFYEWNLGKRNVNDVQLSSETFRVHYVVTWTVSKTLTVCLSIAPDAVRNIKDTPVKSTENRYL